MCLSSVNDAAQTMLVTTLNKDTTEVNDMRLLCLVFSWTDSDAFISILRFVFAYYPFSLLSCHICLRLAYVIHVILILILVH